MSKTIELTDLIITNLKINYDEQYVLVGYSLVDADGKRWQDGVAYFWVTIPPLDPLPDNYYLLPPAYIPVLIGLRDDADAALTAKLLV